MASRDKDGDGVWNDADTCASIANPDQTDTDNDDLGDPCDPCPSGAGSAQNLDADGDGYGDNCPAKQDNCVGVANPDQTDADYDGAGDACDICKLGDDHIDEDGDGIPNACDPCPCDDSLTNDPDGDGVCTKWNRGLGIQCAFMEPRDGDNCPTVPNPKQENANADSEAAPSSQAAIMGNACDPVPVPFAEPKGTETLVAPKVYRWQLDAIELKPIGSHSTGVPPADPVYKAGYEKKVVVGATAERYCLTSQLHGVFCFDPVGALGDAWLTTPASSRAEEVFVGHNAWWHRVTRSVNGMMINPDYDDGPMTYGGGNVYSRKWLYQLDWDFWKTSFAGWPDLPIPETDHGKIGRFWLHGDTEAGTTDLSWGTGLHPKKEQPGVPAAELANFYMPLDPDRRIKKLVPKLAPGLLVPWYFAYKYRACLECPMLSAPALEARPPESQLVAPIATDPGQIGVLTPDGIIPIDPATFGTALRTSLADTSLVWADAAEPYESIGRGLSAPIALALSSDGTEVREVVRPSGGRLVGAGDCERLPSGGGCAPLASLTSATPGTAAPSPRTGFRPVYSRMMGWLLLVGGTDTTTGKPAREIWARSTDGGSWSRITTKGYAPETVLAATFSYGDRRLWILDETAFGPVKMGRLARVDVATGSAEVIGKWPRVRLFDRYWLVADRDGALLFTASSSKLRRHFVIRIRLDAPHPRVAGVHMGGFELVGPPVVDGDGYWLVGKAKADTMHAVRAATLQGSTGGWGHVGACM
jgi:hypothetical protein